MVHVFISQGQGQVEKGLRGSQIEFGQGGEPMCKPFLTQKGPSQGQLLAQGAREAAQLRKYLHRVSELGVFKKERATDKG